MAHKFLFYSTFHGYSIETLSKVCMYTSHGKGFGKVDNCSSKFMPRLWSLKNLRRYAEPMRLTSKQNLVTTSTTQSLISYHHVATLSCIENSAHR